jgi:hypothetical protein
MPNPEDDLSAAIDKYLAAQISEGHTPEKAKAKAFELFDEVRKATVQDRRDAFRVVGDVPPDNA